MLIVSQDKTKTTERLEFYINEHPDDEMPFEIRSLGGQEFLENMKP